MSTEVAATLSAGMSILAPVMEAHGFVPLAPESGKGSGGHFASAAFSRGNRRLELHFRTSLGLVRYHLGDVSVSHEDYMWAVTGKRWSTQYPGFSNEPHDAFRRLRADVEHYASSFLSGSDGKLLDDVRRAARLQEATPKLP